MADWLDGWSNCYTITIPSTNIDSALTNYPLLIKISSSSGTGTDDLTYIFDQLGANSQKIAITTSNGTTQCYVEIEKWDNSGEEAILWAKVPSVSNSTTTTLYLYFDAGKADNSSYVGVINSTPGKTVWDSNFQLVLHMTAGATSTVKDSTSNENNGTKKATGEPLEAYCKIGEGQTFDGTDDYITLGTPVAIDKDAGTLELIWKTNVDFTGQYGDLGHIIDNNNQYLGFFGIYQDSSVKGETDTNEEYFINKITTPSDNSFHYIGLSFNRGTVTSILDGSSFDSQSVSDDLTLSRLGGHANTLYGGSVDELRISSIARSNAYIKANYYNFWDNLVSYSERPAITRVSRRASAL